MCKRFMTAAVVATAMLGGAGAAQAASVTPDIIFGSGNANGSFTVDTRAINFPHLGLDGNIELGLRAKLRYNASGLPENTFNWDGVDTYTFDIADGNAPGNRAMWNFEWSVNVEDTGGTIPQLAGIGTLILEFDVDPGAGTTFMSYNVADGDAYYGTNSTPNGGGTYDATGTPVAGSTVAQNSVNYGFIPGAPLGTGTYDIRLTAFSSGGATLAQTSMTVNVVPVPAALPLMVAGLGGLAFVKRRRRRAAATA